MQGSLAVLAAAVLVLLAGWALQQRPTCPLARAPRAALPQLLMTLGGSVGGCLAGPLCWEWQCHCLMLLLGCQLQPQVCPTALSLCLPHPLSPLLAWLQQPPPQLALHPVSLISLCSSAAEAGAAAQAWVGAAGAPVLSWV